MKVKILLKDPDGVCDAIADAVMESVSADMPDDDRTDLIENARERAGKVLARWIEYGEYICVEFDTEAETARVLEVAEVNS